jgi:hypothetical protein
VNARRAASVLFAAAVAAAAPLRAQQPAPTADQPHTGVWIESIEHLREGLAKPPSPLTLQDRVPDFSVHIEKRPPMADIFDTPPWQLPPLGWRPPPILGFNLLDLFSKAAGAISEARHQHDERLAREEVQRSIAEYCATATVTAAAVMCPGR